MADDSVAEARRLLDSAVRQKFQGEASAEAARFAAVISRFAGSGNDEVEALVAEARYEVAALQPSIAGEIQHYRSLIARYPVAVNDDLDRVVAVTMFQLAHALRENQQEQQAVLQYRSLIERFSESNDRVIRGQVEDAENNLGAIPGQKPTDSGESNSSPRPKPRLRDAPFAVALACITPAIITAFVWLMAYLDVLNGTHLVRDRGFTTSYSDDGSAVVLMDQTPLTAIIFVVGPVVAVALVGYGIVVHRRRSRAARVSAG